MRHRCKALGGAVICTGAVIVLAMVLPAAAWWLLLGIALIGAGVCLLKYG